MGLKVFTAGTFDLPHSGHVNFLQACAELGTVTVALNTDEFIEAYKGKPPVMSFDERRMVISEFRCVDRVIVNYGNENCAQVIDDLCKDYEIDVIAIGSDWARKDYYKQMGFTQDWLDERHLSLIYIPYTKGISSTEIKRRLGR
jgi:glycerol-3-phosphate cytidylyltransferase